MKRFSRVVLGRQFKVACGSGLLASIPFLVYNASCADNNDNPYPKRVSKSDFKGKDYACSSYPANNPIEDRSAMSEKAGERIFAVFDGHGGWQVAEFAQKRLIERIQSYLENCGSLTEKNITGALIEAFLSIDREWTAKIHGAFDVGCGEVAKIGSCAIVCYFTPDKKSLYVANAGDCRVVLGTSDASSENQLRAVPLSRDHNCKLPFERKKLELGHPAEANIVYCKHPDACYVKQRLQPTRALGDLYLKFQEFNGPSRGDRSRGRHIPPPYTPPYVSAEPEVTLRHIEKEDKFVVVACDGLWDAMTNTEVVEFVSSYSKDNDLSESDISDALVMKALEKSAQDSNLPLEELMEFPPGRQRRRRHDDITAFVVFL